MKLQIFILLLFSILLFSACNTQQAETQNASANAKRYELEGEVLSVDRANKKASIKHKEIEGYMDQMTMDFPIREDWVWDDLTPGAQIFADLVVDNANDQYWLENIKISAQPRADQPPLPVKEDAATIGKQVPDFTLTNQDGEQVSLADFRGKPVAITFIYSECPIPEFCILMSKNFSDAANEIAKNDELADDLRLLSISFDPKRDTPEKLKQYGLGYLGKDSPAKDFKVWQLLTGDDAKIRKIADFFGLRYEVDKNDKTQFNHSLRTIVISPEGKITKVFLGNDWTSNDLLRELKAAGKDKQTAKK